MGDAMSTEIDRIAGTTTWAGTSLMATGTTTFSFQVGAATGTQNQISVDINEMDTEALNVEKTDVDLNTSGTSRTSAIATIDAAIKTVNDQRSELGAVSNRLNHTVNNLTNIS